MNNCRGLLLFCVLLVLQNGASAQLNYNELKVEYDSAWTFRNLEVIPVKFKDANRKISNSTGEETSILSFAEAMQKHKIKLQEMQYEKGADVNWLQLTNHSKQTVMVQSGEIVSGGKQDRMIGETKFIAPGKMDYVHVYCVEKRRWDDKPKDFSLAGVADHEVRKAMDVSGRQAEVWKEIDHQYAGTKKTSETFSYLQLYKDSVRADTAYANYFAQKYRQTDSVFAGYLFITGDRIMSCELFASSDLTNICFTNMLNSYSRSAIIRGAVPVVTLDRMKEFMDKIISSEASQKAYVTAHGKIHSADGKIIHLIAYDD